MKIKMFCLLLLLNFQTRGQNIDSARVLYIAKYLSYGDQWQWESIAEYGRVLNATIARFLPATGWGNLANPVSFISVIHMDRYRMQAEIFDSFKENNIYDTVRTKYIYVNSFFRRKYNIDSNTHDSEILKVYTSIFPNRRYIRDQYLILNNGSLGVYLISHNGIRRPLNSFNKRFINGYYNGFLFDQALVDSTGNNIVRIMKKEKWLRGYPIRFPDKYKKFFTVDGKPTQLFLPDTCFSGLDWEKSWLYKPDY